MKNSIFISIDSEREQPIMVGKPEQYSVPSTDEEMKEMMIYDVECMTDALYFMIENISKNNFGDKKEIVDKCIIKLHSLLTNVEEIKTE